MLAAFCLRLALGMVAFLPLLPAKQMHPRFFRTQFLVALGLSVVAMLTFEPDVKSSRNHAPLIATSFVALVGAIFWSFERPPLGRTISVIATVVFSIGACRFADPIGAPNIASIDALSAGCLLGSSVTSMLVGHAYLISPGLTIKPLINMLIALALCLILRMVAIGIFWDQLAELELANSVLNQQFIYLIPRYLIGLGGPLVFGTMAYMTARIRSTQSATGILFVVVICVFLGELMSLVLTRMAGWPL